MKSFLTFLIIHFFLSLFSLFVKLMLHDSCFALFVYGGDIYSLYNDPCSKIYTIITSNVKQNLFWCTEIILKLQTQPREDTDNPFSSNNKTQWSLQPKDFQGYKIESFHPLANREGHSVSRHYVDLA